VKLYPVEFEIFLDDSETQMATFTAFDDESLSVDIKEQILSPDDLRGIADMLVIAEKLLKKGVQDE